MGSVTKIVTIQDGEGPSGASKYEVHYLYCDNCGSFDLGRWILPENHLQLEKYQRWLTVLTFVAAFSTLIGLVRLIASGAFWWASLSLIALLLLVALQRYLSGQIREKGVRCKNCDAQFEYDSPFFRHLTDNPSQLSLEDMDIPESFAYKLQGRYMGPAELPSK
jgi:hypothetical protein